jgi:hypothetical protein
MSQIENRLKALGFTLPPTFPVPENHAKLYVYGPYHRS